MKDNRWAGYVALMTKMSNGYKIVVGKPEGKKPVVRPTHRLKDMDLRKIVF